MKSKVQNLIDALEVAKKAICHHAEWVCQSLAWENSNIQSNCADILCAHRDLCEAKTAINAALAATSRNCDVGTPEEQHRRFIDYCNACDCPMGCIHRKEFIGMLDTRCASMLKCYIRWSQM